MSSNNLKQLPSFLQHLQPFPWSSSARSRGPMGDIVQRALNGPTCRIPAQFLKIYASRKVWSLFLGNLHQALDNFQSLSTHVSICSNKTEGTDATIWGLAYEKYYGGNGGVIK